MESQAKEEFGILTPKPDDTPGSTRADRSMYKRSIVIGLIAGVLMSLFVGVSGFYITGDNAGFGFFKFLILGAGLVILLTQVKKVSAPGQTLKEGLLYGMVTSATAAVVTAVAGLFFGGPDAVRGSVEEASDVAVTHGTLAAMSLFTTLVAGLILSFIILQFIKDDAKPV